MQGVTTVCIRLANLGEDSIPAADFVTATGDPVSTTRRARAWKCKSSRLRSAWPRKLAHPTGARPEFQKILSRREIMIGDPVFLLALVGLQAAAHAKRIMCLTG